jgi:hypothetical protein
MFTGGVNSSSTPITATGGARQGGTSSTGTRSTLGGASNCTGGLTNATSLPIGGAATGGTFDGGMSTTGGDAGAFDPHLDPAGDATDARGDLLEAHVYLTDATLEAQLRFASTPIPPNLSLELRVASATDEFVLLLDRGDSELFVRSYARNVTLSYETCASASINAADEWLTVRVPALVLPERQLTTFTVASEYGINHWDKMDSGALPVEAGPGPDRDADPVCEPSPRVRKSTVRFQQVSLGNDFGCGLDLAGAAFCWGTDEAMSWVGSVPSGTFEEIAVSNQWVTHRIYACGRRSSGVLECWGDRAPVVNQLFEYISEPFGCGIKTDGEVYCVSEGGVGHGWSSLSMLGAHYVDATGFADKNCALSNLGPLYCWSGIAKPPGDDFIAVELGTETDTCALHKDGSLACGEGHLPPLVFDQIDSPYPNGIHVGCGVQPGGSPLCWGEGGIVARVAPGPFKHIEVSTTGEGICGFKDDDTLECWDYVYVAGNPVPATTPP